ncbi:chemotaxis protein CheW [Aliiglaciecola sp. CAU 1673]|uniref:chemotaxis protein CheA n=1 Tax=Aliiglaciecola sp. CAU 1673 TaxID=3032595 RepID=UPI0023DB20CB|nr:chemotaxis protein CheW [Aliiglaciecola sp. CAU 1673]MDF2177095.1 chemotaxis protein CheW [Aliiglaciecola sp. CAU 1673]
MSIDMEQFRGVFFEESQEHLAEMEHLLMDLDPEAPDPEQLNSIFRAAHSIKGGSGIFGFDALTGLTHVMENLLDKARKGEMPMSVAIVDRLLSTTDILKSILASYSSNTEIDWASIEQGTQALEAILGAKTPAKGAGYALFDSPVKAPGPAYGLYEKTQQVKESEDFGFFEPIGKEEKDDGFGFFEPLPKTEKEEGFGFFEPPAKTEKEDGFGFFEPVAPAAATMQAPPAAAPPLPEEPKSPPKTADVKKAAPQAASPASVESTTIRVDTHKIDALVNLVGELVITQSMLNMIGSDDGGGSRDKLMTALNELERNTREIQEAVMSMRMLPISFVFNRFPRLVRDLSGKLGKQVELTIEGGNTEVDKGLIEKIVDPLTHLIRNSIDHGVEMPQKRVENGKPAQGNILLRAEQKGGSIIITVSDDGGGLNRERILAKAEEQGIAVPDYPTDQQVWQLIFAAGFSTAAAVTDVSGRGVGMDVVRRNIESLGGRIEIESSAGQGSSFVIRLPLTLAIVDGMSVAVGNQVYVVPLVNIIESIQPDESQIRSLGNDKLLWVREEYWPMLNLYQHMGLDGAQTDPAKGIVVLIESAKKRFGLLVDSLVGQQQVVIKSLEQHYKRIMGVAGATIMGDGSVALILDVESLASEVKVQKKEPQTS